MAGYKCTVTGSNSTKQVAPAQAPVYCADDESKCVAGAKQMIVFQRKPSSTLSHRFSARANLIQTEESGNNVEVSDGSTPMYNEVCGFENGMPYFFPFYLFTLGSTHGKRSLNALDPKTGAQNDIFV